MPTEQTTELNGKNPPQATAPPVTELAVTGMTCGNCARHVTEAIQSVPGVRAAMVSLDSRMASVTWAPGAHPDPARVIHAVEEVGYDAQVITIRANERPKSILAGWQLNLWIGVVGTLLLMLGEWVFRLGAT